MKPQACCGEDCGQCPVYKATIHNNDRLRSQALKAWEHIGDFSRFAMNCLGCGQDEVLFEPCSFCKIRPCCREKNLPDCSHCHELFTCPEINKPGREHMAARLQAKRAVN